MEVLLGDERNALAERVAADERRDADHVRLRIRKGEQRLGVGTPIARDADGDFVDDGLARQRQARAR